MMVSSQRTCVQRLDANQAQIVELNALSGKSRDLATKIWQKANEEKEAYNASLAEYKVQRVAFIQKRGALIDSLNPAKLDVLCSRSLQAINDSWTTYGLIQGMRELIQLMEKEFSAVALAGEDIKALMQGVYNIFQERFKFGKMDIPSLDFEGPRNKIKSLVFETEQFCKDPVNVVMTEKRFMVRRFWRMLVDQARKIFSEAHAETERWITEVPQPLELQMKNHKSQLQQRLDSLSKISEKSGSINEEIAKLNVQRKDIERQLQMISGLIAKLRETPGADTAPAEQNQEFLKTVKITSPMFSNEYEKTQKINIPNR
jgi:hypothetical protein